MTEDGGSCNNLYEVAAHTLREQEKEAEERKAKQQKLCVFSTSSLWRRCNCEGQSSWLRICDAIKAPPG